jgi:hypothetical protein
VLCQLHGLCSVSWVLDRYGRVPKKGVVLNVFKGIFQVFDERGWRELRRRPALRMIVIGPRFEPRTSPQLWNVIAIAVSRIIRSGLFHFRPWCVTCPACDFRLVQYAKGATAVHTCRRNLRITHQFYRRVVCPGISGMCIRAWRTNFLLPPTGL